METQVTQAALDALEELRENKRRAKHFDALVEALRGLLPLTKDGKCSLCAEGIERNADMDHWDTGYLDNRCLDHHMFSQARTVLTEARKL